MYFYVLPQLSPKEEIKIIKNLSGTIFSTLCFHCVDAAMGFGPMWIARLSVMQQILLLYDVYLIRFHPSGSAIAIIVIPMANRGPSSLNGVSVTHTRTRTQVALPKIERYVDLDPRYTWCSNINGRSFRTEDEPCFHSPKTAANCAMRSVPLRC